MTKYFCDICGKELLVKTITVDEIKECDYTIFRNDRYGRHPLDLCEKCSTNLVNLIIKEGNKENEQ